jgi:hypothetical protein
VDVHAKGGVAIAIETGWGDLHQLGFICDYMLQWIGGEVISGLDAMVR